MEPIKYEIGDKVYTQSPLVLGQIKQMIEALRDFSLPANARASDIAMMLGDDLPGVLAIVLGLEGVRMRDKDIAALTEELRELVPIKTAIKMVDDFFICNPIASLAESLSGWTKILSGVIPTKNGSTALSSSSPEEISPDGTQSCGDIASGTQSPL